MCKIWIFGGTTEGRLLAEYCSREQIPAWVSVASEYGEELLQEDLRESLNAENTSRNLGQEQSRDDFGQKSNTSLAKKQGITSVKILRGRMDRIQMEAFIQAHGIRLVIDATHPHAKQVSAEIQAACRKSGIRLERCLRAEKDSRAVCAEKKKLPWVEVGTIQEAADFLASVPGTIFATTGSKELEILCQIPEYQKRVYARVLPTSGVLKKCEELGITGSHLMAMQGPFSTEMNLLFLRQTKAEWLLTKDSGRTGGFQEKIQAAQEAGIGVVVIRRPEERGISLEEAMKVLKEADEQNSRNEGTLQEDICMETSGKETQMRQPTGTVCEQGQEEVQSSQRTHLILAGIGMGQPFQMTGEVIQAICESDALIGAGRMLESAKKALLNLRDPLKNENTPVTCCQAYLPEDVIRIVSEHPEWKQAVILYSGDTGFFSGASKMTERLRKAGYPFTVCPGISCISYLAARLGTHWEDAAIYSAHGRELSVDRVMKHLCDPEASVNRAFILMGGKNGAGQFCMRLTQAGYGTVQVTVGENLSYPEERIQSGTAEEMGRREFADLSLMLVEAGKDIKISLEENQSVRDTRFQTALHAFPRIMLAAPKSGSGKTLLTCGLLEILRRRGLNPIACKCGPDYIDPMFHRYVLGLPGRNLDSFFLTPEGVREVLADAVQEESAGIAVLEGVMGYYDGLGGTETAASSWEIAKITDTPAILVLDCKGASLSAAAMASGFLHFQEDSQIAGVILNRVSSMYYERLAAAVERASGLPVLGYLPESEEYRMESRHLGLFLPGEIDRLRERIGRLADQMEKSIAVDRILEIAGMLPEMEGESKGEGRRAASNFQVHYGFEKAKNARVDVGVPESEQVVLQAAVTRGEEIEAKNFAQKKKVASSRIRIGVARDEAFCFYYQENFRLLEQMGVELIYFSPLKDKKIPDGVDGLLFGGGYPENYARELSENVSMRESVRQSIAAGMPFLAECGGFLYLHQSLEGSDGKQWEMAGVYPFCAYRTNRLRRFGYVRLLTPSGLEIHGHEFHYWESEDPGTDWEAVKPIGNRSWRCIHEKGAQIGGFPHLYYASCPEFLKRWLDMCRRASSGKSAD